MGKFFGGLAIATAALCAAAPAQAASFVFSNYAAAPDTSFSLPAVGGISVTATAWSVSGPANNLPKQGDVAVYSGYGLGAITTGENGYNNSHTIDNVGNYDFVRLVFSKAVQLTGFTLSGFSVNGTADTDAWVSYGTGTNAFNTANLWNGYLTRGADVASGDSANYKGSGFSTVWLIGASQASTNRNDGFKIGTVNAVPAAVPEPATWLMMIMGFGAIGGSLRRRNAKAVRVAIA